jgi:hypothetical protein
MVALHSFTPPVTLGSRSDSSGLTESHARLTTGVRILRGSRLASSRWGRVPMGPARHRRARREWYEQTSRNEPPGEWAVIGPVAAGNPRRRSEARSSRSLRLRKRDRLAGCRDRPRPMDLPGCTWCQRRCRWCRRRGSSGHLGHHRRTMGRLGRPARRTNWYRPGRIPQACTGCTRC